MDNIKQLLIEKEREAYLANNTNQALFYASTLDYVISLEEQVNKRDAEVEELQTELRSLQDDIHHGIHSRE